LGTNFIYRLMFLLLCVPQLQDWQIQRSERGEATSTAELGLLGIVLGDVEFSAKRSHFPTLIGRNSSKRSGLSFFGSSGRLQL
jgi:hypothetical protein